MGDILSRLSSRKFLLAMSEFLFVVITELAGITISAEAWTVITTVVLGYIAAEGTADVVERFNKKK